MEKRLGIGRPECARKGSASAASLRAAFSKTRANESPLRGSVELSEPDREEWQALQARASAGSVADADIACLLAYHGVEYRRNVRRLLRSYTLEQAAAAGHWPRDLASTEVFRYVPGHVARLYDRWRDPHLLEWLLVRRPPGSEDRTARYEALLSLWRNHWTALLRAASGSSQRTRSIAAALYHARRASSSPVPWRFYLHRLREAVCGRAVDVRAAALEILVLLRRAREPKPSMRQRMPLKTPCPRLARRRIGLEPRGPAGSAASS